MRVKEAIIGVGRISILFWKAFVDSLSPPFYWGELISQTSRIGADSIPVVFLMGSFTGMVLAVQAYYQFHKLMAEVYVGAVVGLSMVRELGPVLTGLMVAGRSGSAMAAEIGTMRITDQIDALITLGYDPVRFLVVPRILGAVLMAPILTAIADVAGIGGGYLMGVDILGINPGHYMAKMRAFVTPWDLASGLVKSVFFGGIVALVGCYCGMYPSSGATGVGRATTRAVVLSSILIIICDYFLTLILF